MNPLLVGVILIAAGVASVYASYKGDKRRAKAIHTKDGELGNRGPDSHPDRKQRPGRPIDRRPGSVDHARMEPANVGVGSRGEPGDNHGGQRNGAPGHCRPEPVERSDGDGQTAGGEPPKPKKGAGGAAKKAGKKNPAEKEAVDGEEKT